MSMEVRKLKALGQFLRSRRERIQPAMVGISGKYGRRRTPGLRREEVAELAEVSTTWYTWLEQGREVRVSRDVIERIGRALLLSPEEHLHLQRLADYDRMTDPSASPINGIDTGLRQIVEQISYPAIIATFRTDVLVWNRMASIFLTDFDSLPKEACNMTRLVFTDSSLRQNITNWDEFARYGLAIFRSHYDQHPDDPVLEAFVKRLLADSESFAKLWKLHDVQDKKAIRFELNHPGAGPLTFTLNSFSHINGNSDIHLCVYTPVEGTLTEQRMLEFAGQSML